MPWTVKAPTTDSCSQWAKACQYGLDCLPTDQWAEVTNAYSLEYSLVQCFRIGLVSIKPAAIQRLQNFYHAIREAYLLRD